MGFLHRHRRLTPYVLLAPGLVWLAIFFVVPLGFLGYQSLEQGDVFGLGYRFTWAWHNFSDSISTYHQQLIRSFEYAGVATALALLLSLRRRPLQAQNLQVPKLEVGTQDAIDLGHRGAFGFSLFITSRL